MFAHLATSRAGGAGRYQKPRSRRRCASRNIAHWYWHNTEKTNSRRHPPTSKPRQRTRGDQLRHIPRKPAQKAAEREDGVREDEAGLAPEDVAQLSVERPFSRFGGFVVYMCACETKDGETHWKLVSVSMYPVAIQLVDCSCLSSLPIEA